jgi:hypothetical protein
LLVSLIVPEIAPVIAQLINPWFTQDVTLSGLAVLRGFLLRRCVLLARDLLFARKQNLEFGTSWRLTRNGMYAQFVPKQTEGF